MSDLSPGRRHLYAAAAYRGWCGEDAPPFESLFSQTQAHWGNVGVAIHMSLLAHDDLRRAAAAGHAARTGNPLHPESFSATSDPYRAAAAVREVMVKKASHLPDDVREQAAKAACKVWGAHPWESGDQPWWLSVVDAVAEVLAEHQDDVREQAACKVRREVVGARKKLAKQRKRRKAAEAKLADWIAKYGEWTERVDQLVRQRDRYKAALEMISEMKCPMAASTAGIVSCGEMPDYPVGKWCPLCIAWGALGKGSAGNV